MRSLFLCGFSQIAPLPYICVFSDTRLGSQRANDVRPYILVLWFAVPQNRCALCGGCFAELDSISGAGLCFDFCFVIEEHLVFFFFLSAPLGRLAPIEALPQAPLRALP